MIKFPALFVTMILAGCQAAPPVQSDKYYRLDAVGGVAPEQAILNESLYVAPLRADGLYAERAMLFTSFSQQRELQQYHYQHWSKPPPVLLQEHMRASFEAMALAPFVTDVAINYGYVLNGKILRLEKIIDGKSARAVVSLHIALQRKKPSELVLERSYSAEEAAYDNTQHAYVMACEAGLKKIYAKLAEDIKLLR